MTAVTGSGIQDVLNGVASLLWPVVVLLSIALFRPEIRSAMKRISELNIFGNSVKFQNELTDLQADSQKLAESPIEPVALVIPETTAPTLTASGVFNAEFSSSAAGVVIPQPPPSPDGAIDSEIQDVLAVAATSPKAGLMQLSATLEKLIRRIIALTGHMAEIRSSGGMADLTNVLERAIAMPPGSLDALRAFTRIRNEIVHGT